MVNPDSVDYIDYYLEDKNYALFGPQIACDVLFEVSDYTIETDNSIWPFESFQYDKGFFIKDKALLHPFQYSAGVPYLDLYISKSSDSYTYKRVVQKVSEVFSFVGGIVGACSAVLFFLHNYTDFSLEVMIASTIFRKKK